MRGRLKLRTISNIPGLMGIAVTDGGTVFLSSSKEQALFSLKEEEMLGGSETLTKVCGETAGHRDGVQSRWNKPTALCVYRNTVFVCDTGNKAVRMLTSAKGLIPLQSKMAQYANVFRLDKKAKEEDLRRTFEDHVKSVEELVAFLSNHEQEALERTGKRNTNGPDMTIPRCTRQWKTICCAFIRRISHISLGPIHFIRKKLSKVKPQTSRGDQTSSQQSLKEQVARKKTQGEKLRCANLLGSMEEA